MVKSFDKFFVGLGVQPRELMGLRTRRIGYTALILMMGLSALLLTLILLNVFA